MSTSPYTIWADDIEMGPTDLPPLPIEWATDRKTGEVVMYAPSLRAPAELEDDGWTVVARVKPKPRPLRLTSIVVKN